MKQTEEPRKLKRISTFNSHEEGFENLIVDKINELVDAINTINERINEKD